ncbi:hypothetical protein LVW35_15985 [Pseudomonas sp. HN11]|uniref:hypothetical protein n=1 Tax=Pseudomonas sp. HN11 TaxID=1344094 RepID=UPI001F2BE7EC|nr:hypothetical protein [Pseudomonas sp. HN11]UII69188.1 hypothetical protein LVW35_15985 [Pseudomonas sp. HN11]
MTNIHSSFSTFALQATPEALRLASPTETPNKESARITVREEAYPRVIDLLSEAARRNDVQVTIGQPESSDLDYGDGPMNSMTFSYNFHPDKTDGTYSQEYLSRVNKTTQTFDDWLRIEGIRNYGPED